VAEFIDTYGDCRYLLYRDEKQNPCCVVASNMIRQGYALNSNKSGDVIRCQACINTTWYEPTGREIPIKENCKKMVDVMLAYVDGKQIQVSLKEGWRDITGPEWDWSTYDYRVKPKPLYRSYRPEELKQLKNEWLIHARTKSEHCVIGIDCEENAVYMTTYWFSAEKLFLEWVRQDSSPCGALVLEETEK